MFSDASEKRPLLQRFSEASLNHHPARAWFYLVLLSWRRQARARQMVWIALALLGFTATVVGLNTAMGRWSMDHWRSPRGFGPRFDAWWEVWEASNATVGAGAPARLGVTDAVLGASRAVLDRSGFLVFSRHLVYSIFVSFLLPFWGLCFATEALGGDRESRSLIWVLSRPLPRWSIYLAKFAALLPWAMMLNLGGFFLLCLAAGEPGRLAFRLYWPAVMGATLAFCALFHLMAALFRRPALVAIFYTFFLEIIVGNMPGYMKRISIGFYTRCLMFDAAENIGMQPPERASIYVPVSGSAAWTVLLAATVALLLIGMTVFARSEYRDEA